MTQFTLGMLQDALRQLPPQLRDKSIPIRAVIKTTLDPIEGNLLVEHVAITGVAAGVALVLFIDQSGQSNKNDMLPGVPPATLDTGNPDITALQDRGEEDNSGEDWKKG